LTVLLQWRIHLGVSSSHKRTPTLREDIQYNIQIQKGTIIMYEQEKLEIIALKSYLLTQIPNTPLSNDILLSQNSIALTAAISGLDKELVRLEREERLVKKFAAANNNTSSSAMKASTSMADDMEYVKMSKDDAAMSTGSNIVDVKMEDGNIGKRDEDEEWEEANPSPIKQQKQECTNQNNAQIVFCQSLASAVVSRIATANIKVASPLGALGLSLHTALVELSYEDDDTTTMFTCTGVPDDQQVISQLFKGKVQVSGGGGFASPIRELPRGELVPTKWEEKISGTTSGGAIAFRYKSLDDTAPVYLTLQLQEGNEVYVTCGTLEKNMATSTELRFSLEQYANLIGFQAAKTKNGGGAVSPSLFYISLSELLFKFTSTFGLLSRKKASVTSTAMTTNIDVMTNHQGAVPSCSLETTKMMNVPRPNVPRAIYTPDHTDPLRVMDTQRKGKHKDFEGDLLPGGPQPGGLHDIPNRGGMGSQVGPNHPMFDRTFGDDVDNEFGGEGPNFGLPGVGGGMGMHPRFDYYGPPNGPTEQGRSGRGQFPGRGSRLGRGRGRGGRGSMPLGGFGDPNNDHMRPPNSDYFS